MQTDTIPDKMIPTKEQFLNNEILIAQGIREIVRLWAEYVKNTNDINKGLSKDLPLDCDMTPIDLSIERFLTWLANREEGK